MSPQQEDHILDKMFKAKRDMGNPVEGEVDPTLHPPEAPFRKTRVAKSAPLLEV